MKLTEKQVDKINKLCKNGFYVNVFAAAYRNEKELSKFINIDDKNDYKISLFYSEKYKNFKVDKISISLNITIWHKTPTADYSLGMGYFLDFPHKGTKKDYKSLANLTEKLTDEYLFDIIESKNAHQAFEKHTL